MGEEPFQLGGFVGAQGAEETSFVVHVLGEGVVDQIASRWGQDNDSTALVLGGASTGHQPGVLKSVDALGHAAGGDHRELGQLSRSPLEGRTGAAKGGEHIELTLAETMATVDHAQLLGQIGTDAVQSPDHALR